MAQYSNASSPKRSSIRIQEDEGDTNQNKNDSHDHNVCGSETNALFDKGDRDDQTEDDDDDSEMNSLFDYDGGTEGGNEEDRDSDSSTY